MHAPGLHHLVGLLVLVIGAILLIRRLIELFTDSGNSRNKGALLIHAVAVIVFILFFKLIILNGAIKRDTGDLATSGTLAIDRQTKMLLLSNGVGDTLFHQVADSIFVDSR
jgi:membrane-bound ClpP family serine protease